MPHSWRRETDLAAGTGFAAFTLGAAAARASLLLLKHVDNAHQIEERQQGLEVRVLSAMQIVRGQQPARVFLRVYESGHRPHACMSLHARSLQPAIDHSEAHTHGGGPAAAVTQCHLMVVS